MRDKWTPDDAAGFGRQVYEEIPEKKRPGWAADLLDICSVRRLGISAVERVVAIGQKPYAWDWHDAHAAFQEVRALSLANARPRHPDAELQLLLDIAETAAKIIYNASGGSAPFDYDAGWYMAPRVRALVLAANDLALDDRAWKRLAHSSIGGAG